MPELAAQKLREAEFFLQKMRDCNPTHLDSEELLFYLSAFLSAARSVTFTLKAENKERYDAFFPTWGDGLASTDKALLQFAVEQRNAAQKRGSVDLTRDVRFVDLGLVARASVRPIVVRGAGATVMGGGVRAQQGVRHWEFSINDQPIEVIAFCQRYLELLRELLRRYEEAFG